MKKLLTTFFAVIFAGAVTAAAQVGSPEAIPFTFTAPTEFKGVGSTFTIPLTITDVTGDGIISFQFDVVFDENLLTPDGANFGCNSPAGTIAGNAGFFVICNVPVDDPGRLKVAAFGSVMNLSGAGTLMNLTFTANVAVPNGSVSPLDIQSDMFFSNAFPSVPGVPHTTVDGQVTIIGTTAAPTTVSGQVVNQLGRPITSARLYLTDMNGKQYFTVTKRKGVFTFKDVPAGETYILSILAPGYSFASMPLEVNDSINGLTITSN